MVGKRTTEKALPSENRANRKLVIKIYGYRVECVVRIPSDRQTCSRTKHKKPRVEVAYIRIRKENCMALLDVAFEVCVMRPDFDDVPLERNRERKIRFRYLFVGFKVNEKATSMENFPTI